MRKDIFNKKIISALLLLFLAPSSGCISTCRKDKNFCAAKYPVLLVHGVAFRDETLSIRYWGTIPSSLEKNGAAVFTGNQQAYGTIKANAEQLKARVNEILRITGSEKVNIIAHSRGGLESRYMISMYGMADKVASLTTLATPHRGSSMADYILKHIADKQMLAVIIDFYAKIIGDTSPDSLKSAIELTTYKMKQFNKIVKDSDDVYYQSYACAIDNNFHNPFWKKMYSITADKEGGNDGLVSVTSAQWGNFRGVVNCDGKPLVTHADIVGMHFLSGEYCFDADDFFINIVHELKLSGY
jgi:triacylglycerol lipase